MITRLLVGMLTPAMRATLVSPLGCQGTAEFAPVPRETTRETQKTAPGTRILADRNRKPEKSELVPVDSD
jgi:hypothetical protein